MRIANTEFFGNLTRTTEFVLLRHGESEGNTSGIFQGRKDYPLSAKGRKQAEQAGRALAGYPHTTILSSPLARARETAELIAREACLPDPSISDRLIELETGMFTGRSWYEIKEKDPEAWDRFHHESAPAGCRMYRHTSECTQDHCGEPCRLSSVAIQNHLWHANLVSARLVRKLQDLLSQG